MKKLLISIAMTVALIPASVAAEDSMLGCFTRTYDRSHLAKHPDQFAQTVTERLMMYALGRNIEAYDMPAIRTIARDAAKSNNRFSSLVLGIVKSSAFQMSKAEAPTTAAGK